MNHLFKKLSFLLLLLIGLNLQARIRVGKVEEIKTVAQLPRTQEFVIAQPEIVLDDKTTVKADNYDYLNLGLKYTVFVVAGLPYGVLGEPVLVGTSTLRKDMYYELTPQEEAHLLSAAKLTKAQATELSFMEKYLGWLVTAVIVGGYLVYVYFIRKDEPDVIED